MVLMHHPVLDGQGDIVTTAVTNLDVHDIARSARTYGCSDYFVVHPIAAQRELVTRIRDHWIDGPGGKRIPDRRDALGVLRIVDSLATMLEVFGGRDGVELWATAARDLDGRTLRFEAARERLEGEGKPIAIVFGTGWGLAPEVLRDCDARLQPIRAVAGEYNHLSVRAACAIALDRLLGVR